ncbi:Uncharacterised protein [uncultured archaeon]|nr:Uncharacterised protein [uncultured archaeon]
MEDNELQLQLLHKIYQKKIKSLRVRYLSVILAYTGMLVYFVIKNNSC